MLSSVEAWLCLTKTATVLGITGTILSSVTMAVITDSSFLGYLVEPGKS